VRRAECCCTSVAQASRTRPRTQLLARTGTETGRTLKYCKVTWSASASASSPASLEEQWRRPVAVDEAPCC
jgi:hypothetical protein